MIYLSYIAITITVLCMIPQVIKTIHSKDLSAISNAYFFWLGIANLLWIFYAVDREDAPIVIVNTISFFCCSSILWIKSIRQSKQGKN